MSADLRIAVVGHTNTGKTSLLRTLARDAGFGEVSDRPAVTRRVATLRLEVPGSGGVELYDTPGLEDSPGLLEYMTNTAGVEMRSDPVAAIRSFLASEAARTRFAQEAQAIAQVLESSVAIYVIDARESPRGRHRDELTILGMCGLPVVPVLNFVATNEARTEDWHASLRRVGMHAFAAFDTVVYDEDDERTLYEKIATLRDDYRATVDALLDYRTRQRRTLERAAGRAIAELLIDAASIAIALPVHDQSAIEAGVAAMKDAVRQRETACVAELLDLFRFRREDVDADGLRIEDGVWGLDLFSAEAMRQFGLRTGGAAAAGAAVGVTLDVLFAGLSLGTGALAGAAIGGAIGAARQHGRRLANRLRGRTELRVSDGTVHLLAARQVALVEALLTRGHASLERLALGVGEGGDAEAAPRPGGVRTLPLFAVFERMPAPITRARSHPAWSGIAVGGHEFPGQGLADGVARSDAVSELADVLRGAVVRAR